MEFFERNKNIVTFVFFTLFSIVSLATQGSGFNLTFEAVGSAVVYPFQKGYDSVQGGVKRLWAGVSQLNNVRDELEKTRLKLQKYEGISDEVGEIRNENQRLRELLGLKKRLHYDTVAATIISKDPDNWYRTLIINRGYGDGIKVGMPVIAYKGGQKAVVGKVSEVRSSISRIVPIISPNLYLGVKLQNGGFPGLMVGYSQNSDLCVIDYLKRGVSIKYNDIVVTSGQGGVFPAGMYVGKIQKIVVMDSSAYQRALLSPIIDYGLLDEVFVIKKVPEKDFTELVTGAN